MKYNINDILFTKDGRKIGNVIIIDVHYFPDSYLTMSDYGNKSTIPANVISKYFYVTSKKADSTHKYYDYKLNHLEDFI